MRSAGVFAAGTLIVAANLWLADSVFVPIAQDGGRVDYLLVSTPLARAALWLAAAAVACAVLYALGGVSAVRPAFWLFLSLVPLIYLLPRAAGRLPAFSYVLYDLRYYWWAALGLVFALRRHGARVPAGHLALVALSLAVAVASTPHLRFSGMLHGDEPKYIRYCETFFQGNGFDVSKNRRLTDPAGAPAANVTGNLRHVATAVREEAWLLVQDVRRMAGADLGPRPQAGEPGPPMFFRGKHSGTVYQLHNPGLSFLLFPGYYLDRRLTGGGVGYHGEFPARMPAVHATLLALYAGYAFALLALLRSRTDHRGVAWALALAAVVTLPAAAFPFQMYPEIPAGLIIFILVWALLNGLSGSRRALMLGALAGFLPWLHVRFSVATLVTIIWAWTRSRETRRPAVAFTAGTVAVLALLSLYTYRLTGSLVPVATYGSDAPLSATRMLQGLPASALDAVWGVLPHSPLYLLALPGIGMALRRRSEEIWILAVVVAVAVPAAGHGFWAGGSTPGRYLVAVLPLLMVFVARTLQAWPASARAGALALILAALSVEAAVNYNLTHRKEFGPLIADAFSAWRPRLLFPSMGRDTWALGARDFTLFVAWIVTAVAAIVIGWRRAVVAASAPATSGQVVPQPPLPTQIVRGLLVVALVGSIVGLAVGRTSDPSLLLPRRAARERALAAYAARPDAVLRYSSAGGALAPPQVLGNALGRVHFRVRPDRPRAGARTIVIVRPRTTSGEYAYAAIDVDFGDGKRASRRGVFGDAAFEHAYDRAGDYEVTAVVTTPAGDRVQSVTTVRVEQGPSRP